MEVIRIPNIANYTQEEIDGDLILTPKRIYITEDEIASTNVTKSTIMDCVVMNNSEIISQKKKYRGILTDIWKTMPLPKMSKNTSFNYKQKDKKGEKGYKWCPDLHMSFQDKDANGTLQEIITMINVNNYNIKMTIKLSEGEIVCFDI